MSGKKLLRFYFRAGALNDALDRLILRSACASALSCAEGEKSAGDVLALVRAKAGLCALRARLHVLLSGLRAEERCLLRRYSCSDRGYAALAEGEAAAVRRLVARIMRRGRGFADHAEAAGYVERYYAFLGR